MRVVDTLVGAATLTDGSFYPPVQYSPVWLVIGVVLVALVIGWLVFVLLLTRRRAEPYEYVGSIPQLTETVRDAYLARIDDVGRRYDAGAVTFSDAHHELSALVRSFASDAQGVRARFMTLDDLRRTPHRALAETVERLYPGAFSGNTGGRIDDAIARASELVRTWN
ncbi:hypothetical protein GCM10027413_22610 [Conyzicola nivalis]|uniref:Uncharacterized protein n=1 Tax=Conyzicola nivalis TaxID=1477021 RepID=A0A916SC52_9MICO|nr:hypothetical protein [Conyzicola nivalis]GGA92607.1 hypothetical protein GCM10010979_04010 [Conyzicola nivalis]